jgi:NADH-quinone oxidoreductase subunit D
MRIGGVSHDLPAGSGDKIKKIVAYMRPKLDDLEAMFSANRIFTARTKGIGTLTAEKAVNYGVTGPNLRASGVKWDLRKDEPYECYDKFDFDIPTGRNGDAWDRYKVRMEEMRQSLRIIEQAAGGIPEGDPTVKAGKIFRPAPGQAYVRSENPRGELGFYIVSDGSPMPYRLKIRAPSFSNIAVLPELIKGLKVADAVCVLGSLDVVMGEIDR